jgi:GDP-D-mannose dehydratase
MAGRPRWARHVEVNARPLRPAEVDLPRGDCSKAKAEPGRAGSRR